MLDHTSAPCPHCGTALRVKPAYFGHEVVCKYCQKPFVLKAPGDDQTPASESNREEASTEPTALEKMWESETVRPAPPRPPKPVRRAPARPALAKSPVDLEDSSMLIPVYKGDATTSVAEKPPEPARPKPAPVSTPPTPVDPEPESRRELQIRALRQEIERREQRVAQVEAQIRVERGAIADLRAELERVERS